MKITLIATWPNGARQTIFSKTGRQIASSTYNKQLRKEIIVIDEKNDDLIEAIWSRKNPPIPMVATVSESGEVKNIIGSEIGPVTSLLQDGNDVVLDNLNKINSIESASEPGTPKETVTSNESGEIVIETSDDDDEEKTLDEEICQLVLDYKSLKVSTIAKNLERKESEIIAEVKKSKFVKIIGKGVHRKVVAK